MTICSPSVFPVVVDLLSLPSLSASGQRVPSAHKLTSGTLLGESCIFSRINDLERFGEMARSVQFLWHASPDPSDAF
jgi:hypothetical protein